MTRKLTKSRVIALSVFIVFTIHLSFTILFLLTPMSLRGNYSRVVDHYMLPFFSQNWRLFVPRKLQTERLLYRCDRGDRHWSDWQDPMGAVLGDLWARPYNPRVLRLYQNLTGGLVDERAPYQRCDAASADTCDAVSIADPKLPESVRVASRFALDQCSASARADRIQLKVARIASSSVDDGIIFRPVNGPAQTETP